MGDLINHEVTGLCRTTSLSLYYDHPTRRADRSPAVGSKLGNITAGLTSGAQTGKVSIYVGNPGSLRKLASSPLTATAPILSVVDAGVVLQPGQQVHVYFENVTATDAFVFTVEGH